MRIGWLAVGNESVGSSRIGVFNISRTLRSMGYDSDILYHNPRFYLEMLEPEGPVIDRINSGNYTHIVIQKLQCSKTKKIIEFCKKKGIKVLFATGDWYSSDIYSLVDKVVVGSPHTRDKIKTLHNKAQTYYIDDAIETGETNQIKFHIPKETINLGWFGIFTKLSYTKSFIESLNLDTSFKFISISDCKEATYNMGQNSTGLWDPSILDSILRTEIDIVVLPVDKNQGLDSINAKTANKLTTSLSLGLPVVYTPLSSYSSILTKSRSCFPCDNTEQWVQAINKLKDPRVRNNTLLDHTLSIREDYSLINITKKWLELFKE